MAFKERAGRAFTKCDAFWDAQTGETLTGVLIDCNEKFPNKIQGANATKPLYIFKLTGEKTDKASLNLEDDTGTKKAVKVKKGLVVGVFDCDDLHVKIFDVYEATAGHAVQMTYEKKESFTAKGGAQRSVKRFKVLVDDDLHAEFAADVAKKTVSHSSAAPSSGASDEDGETGPFKVDAPAS